MSARRGPRRAGAGSALRALATPSPRPHRRIAAYAVVLAGLVLAVAAPRPLPAEPPHPPPASKADPPYDARLVRVVDGDSLEVEAGGARIELRLFGIDAPERGQPWSRRSRQALAALVAEAPLRIVPRDRDSYGRTVADVYAKGVCVGCALLRDGHAWVYRRYSDDPRRLALEAAARAAGRGLWGLPEAERVAPWAWRHASDGRTRRGATGRSEASAARDDARDARAERGDTAGGAAASDATPARCGTKRRCREMRSCAEALFHLRCGVTTLDGDGDGQPCEALCRREAEAAGRTH